MTPAQTKLARLRFVQQRCNADRRGIAWRMSFECWLAIWLGSGHWRERGVCRGQFCMARHGDRGPYSASNVSIVPNAVNIAAGQVPFTPERCAKIAAGLKGNTNGAGHRTAAARKHMRDGCKRRHDTPWLDHMREVTATPAYRRKMSKAVKAAWAAKREASP